MRTLKTPESKKRREVLKKFLKDVEVNTKNIRGKFSVVGYRKYSFYEEVDVVFDGQFFGRYKGKNDWIHSSVLENRKETRVSLIKVNKILRRNLFKDIEIHCKYFSVDVRDYSSIKKINWV